MKHKPPSEAAHITVGGRPVAIGVAPGRVYVVDSGDEAVSVINAKNNTRIGKDIKVGNEPGAIAVAPGKIYVANSGSNTVSVIDETNNTKIGKDIQVGKYPTAIAFDVGTNTIYVANTDDSTVSVINTTNNTKIGNPIKVINRPAGIAVVPAKAAGSANVSGRIYVSNTNNNTVSVIDDITNTKIGNPIKVGNGPTAIELLQLDRCLQ